MSMVQSLTFGTDLGIHLHFDKNLYRTLTLYSAGHALAFFKDQDGTLSKGR